MVSGASLVQAILSFSVAKPANLSQLFGPSLSPEAQIILPTDTDWSTQVQLRWTNYRAPKYLGAIKPATETDVQRIVKIADANKIPFLTTGGGHGISDYSPFEGIAIDLGNFKSVELDASTNRLTIGGATEYSQLHNLLYDAGKELTLASCPCVGVLGATMGAGFGPLKGHRGLLLDALESVRMVTADGRLVTASARQNPDLFWAVRGAGANFGVVTSATFKVYDITNKGQVMVADLVYPASANHTFWRTLQSFEHAMPSRLALTAVAVYNRTIDLPLIVLHAVYFGPQEDGEAYLEPFKDLGPLVSNIAMIPQNTMFPSDHGTCVPNQRINLYTLALKQFDPPTFDSFYARLTDFWREYPDYQGRLLIQRFSNDAVAAVPDAETAYPWRDAIAHMNIESFYTDPGNDDAINDFVTSARARFAETSGFDTLATYVNFAHGDEGPTAWYSARKLQKLSALKRQWDPKGLFSWHNPVPMRWDLDISEKEHLGNQKLLG